MLDEDELARSVQLREMCVEQMPDLFNGQAGGARGLSKTLMSF